MSRRWLARTLTAAAALFIVTGSVLSALYARYALATGALLAVAAVACIVGALAVVRGTRGRS